MTFIGLELLMFISLIFLSGILSATETAYTGLTYHQLKRINKLYPGHLSLWEKSPHRVLATLLLSNNAVNTAVGVLAAVLAGELASILGWQSPMLSLVFSFFAGSFILVFGEVLPKIMAQRYSVSWALRISPFMRRLVAVVSPAARLASSAANFIVLRFTRRVPKTPFINKSMLRRLLLHAKLPTASHKIINNIMGYAQGTVKDVFQPRSEVFAVSITLPLDRVVRKVIQSGYSRVPVYRNGLDDVVGLLLTKDLLVAWRSGTLIVFEDLLRPILTVSDSKPLPDLLRLFRSKHQHMALVRNDTTGRVDGLVTLQNALEALVGDIKEES
jgi:putative hemolysin